MAAGDHSARVLFEPYLLPGVQEGPEIGHGSYAAVFEVNYKGLKCAAKKIHPILRQQHGANLVLRRFNEECSILSQIRHPNIVQFIGVYFEGTSTIPALVMEYLPMTLVQCIDSYPWLPNEITMAILQDVAVALRFLHESTPVIIHRDLSANNVLLSPDMRAKLSDLGVAKILNISPSEAASMTVAPGTQCYMPPEALTKNPRYNVQVDVFSYGVMVVHLLSGKWPFPSEAVVVTSDNVLTPMSEANRRSEAIDKIPRDHPLLTLIHRCLENNPFARPSTAQVHERVTQLVGRYPQSYQTRLDMLVRINDLKLEKEKAISEQKNSQAKCKEMEKMLEDYQTASSLEQEEDATQISCLRADVEQLQEQLAATSRTVASKDKTIADLLKQAEKARHALKERIKAEAPPPSSSEQGSSSGLLSPHAKLVWTECAEVPAAMFGAQAVEIAGVVYVGGGGTGDDATRRVVFKYVVAQDKWGNLPDAPVIRFGIGSVAGRLVLVGGALTRNTQVCKVIHAFDGGNWVPTLVAPMLTERCAPGVISHASGLVVAGGNNNQVLKCVEVYNVDSEMWFAVGCLPIPWNWMSSVVIREDCFIVRGYDSLSASSAVRSVCTGSLEQLFAARDERGFPTSRWHMLAEVPTFRATVTTIAGSLVAVGGQNGPTVGPVRATIYAYCPSNSSWLEVGEMPGVRSDCACVALPSGEALVIGGWNGSFQRTATVFKCSLIMS